MRAQPGVPRPGLDEQHGDERDAHPGLRDDGAPRGSCDAPVQPVDEDEVERDVRAEADDRGDERCGRVLQAAEDAGDSEDGEHGRDAQRGDAQVGRRLLEHGRGGAEDRADRTGPDGDDGSRAGAEPEGEPQPVDAGAHRRALVAGAEVTGDDARRAVGEEDEDAGAGDEGGARDSQPGELGRAEVADDRGVGEQEERLGDERQEGRDRKADDLAAVTLRGWGGGCHDG